MAFTHNDYFTASLSQSDPELAAAIQGECRRQSGQIELIASENLVSRSVLAAQGSVMTNKTVEGYPGKRYYGGAEFADIIENLAISRARQLFDCQYANVQPHSGSNANQAAYLACLSPGATILSMNIAAGGHISHGHPATLTGRHYKIVSYGLHRDTECIDYEEIETLAENHRPQLIIAGGSAYPRIIDFPRLRRIADQNHAVLLVDMAHFAGLVATGLYPSPLPYAHIVTSTTYKSLRGARGGMILCNDKQLAKKIDNAVFPGVQGSVMLHSVAAKAACLGEALRTEFKDYNQAVLQNARALAQTLTSHGIRVVSGGTDTGLMLIDLRQQAVTGDQAVELLERAGLTCNKNLIPFDPQPPEIASGLRLSSNAGTTRGFTVIQFQQIGHWIARLLAGPDPRYDSTPNENIENTIRSEVRALCQEFPVYPPD